MDFHLASATIKKMISSVVRAGSELCVPVLAHPAESLGAHGERLEQPAEIIPGLERALASHKAAVLDIAIHASREHLEPAVKLLVRSILGNLLFCKGGK